MTLITDGERGDSAHLPKGRSIELVKIIRQGCPSHAGLCLVHLIQQNTCLLGVVDVAQAQPEA